MSLKYIERKAIHILIIVITSITFSYGQSKLSTVPDGVSIFQLDNGIEVMLIEKPSLPMVGINTLVKVGSAYENFTTSGMSHMLEHLLFNGTNTMTQKELYDSTDIIGGYNNAHTGRYFTNFMMVTPFENIIEGMKLQSAMLFDSVIPEEKFEKEKGIVLEEIAKSLAKSSEVMERNINSIIYSGHALSLPTLGTYSTIQNMKRDDVYDFYKNYYVPNNMIITVIGNFRTNEMLDNINSIYGKYSPGIIKQNRNSLLSFGLSDELDDINDKVFHRFYNGEKTHLQLFYDIDNKNRFEFFNILKLSLDKHKEKIKRALNEVSNNQIEGLEFTVRESPVKNYLQVSLALTDDKNLGEIKNELMNSLSSVKYELAPETIENESIKARTRFLKNTEKPHMFGIYNASIIA
ncbi:MAG: insulinase family protein, partial [Melioribacteraceae bacterium]|nr:insulinase family protein [Melioribacteraceae bacterium]